MEILIVLLFPLALPLFIWLFAILLDKKAAKIMQTKSEFPINTDETLYDVTQSAARKCTIDLINLEGIESSWKRRYLIERSQFKLKKILNYNLAIGLGYIIIPAAYTELTAYLNHITLEKVAGIPPSTLGMSLIIYHVFLYRFFENEIRLGVKEPYSTKEGVFEKVMWMLAGIYGTVLRLVLRLFKPVLKFLPNVFDMFYPILLFFICIDMVACVVNNIKTEDWVRTTGLGLAIGFHIFLHIKLLIWLKRQDNYKLLILRVFNVSTYTNFIFKNICKYWRHVGSYFTVVDKSLMDLQSKKIWRNYIPIVFFGYIIIGSFLLSDKYWLLPVLGIKDADGTAKILLIIIAILSAIYIIYKYRHISKSFIKNHIDLDKRLAHLKKNPIGFLSTFKESPVKCFDNTWAFLVAEFAQFADVILMDLRGYSESRKGCHQEVILLLNLVPSSKVIFLMEPEDIGNIYDLFEEACKNISNTSPNFEVDVIEVNLFVMLPGKEHENTYSENIIAALINSTPIKEKRRAVLSAGNN